MIIWIRSALLGLAFLQETQEGLFILLQYCLIFSVQAIFSVYSGDKEICQKNRKEKMLMTMYETIKAAVPMKQAAKHYGLKVSHNGMACCPFHNDRHPSMKLNEEYFFCFGCGA